MQLRRLGDKGPQVSALGLGTNNFGWHIGLDESRAVLDAALDNGVTLLDTADIYGGTKSETFLGELLAGRRDQAVIITKFGYQLPSSPEGVPRGSMEYIRWALDGSLQRLQTDSIDVYMYHRPDGETPMRETVEAMGDVVRAGKARYVGVSNVDAAQMREAVDAARAANVPLVCVENRYNIVERGADADIIPLCRAAGLGLLPFYPLASGMLTGKYRRGQAPPEETRLSKSPETMRAAWMSDAMFDKIERLEAYASSRGISPLEAAIGGLLGESVVASVIAGATRPEQITANAEAAAWQPTEADLKELRALA